MTLNARIHGGLPQNRERLFIIGMKRATMKTPMVWPGRMPMKNIKSFVKAVVAPTLPPTARQRKLIKIATKHVMQQGQDPSTAPVVIDHQGSKPAFSIGYSPCLTANRAAAGGHFLLWKNRTFDMDEMIELMGVSSKRVQWLNAGISKTAMGSIIGNSIPVTLLARILARFLPAAGLSD